MSHVSAARYALLRHLATFGKGELDKPTGVAVRYDGTVLVTDGDVKEFACSGTEPPVYKLSKTWFAPPGASPYGGEHREFIASHVAVDLWGRATVSERGAHPGSGWYHVTQPPPGADQVPPDEKRLWVSWGRSLETEEGFGAVAVAFASTFVASGTWEQELGHPERRDGIDWYINDTLVGRFGGSVFETVPRMMWPTITALAVDKHGTVFAGYKNRRRDVIRVRQWSAAGRGSFIAAFPRKEKARDEYGKNVEVFGKGVVDEVTGIAADAAGNLLVLDAGGWAHKVHVFSPKLAGGYAHACSVQLRCGGGRAMFHPSAIAVDDEGRVFVADKGDGEEAVHVLALPRRR